LAGGIELRRESGSTLVTVLAAITMLTVMLTSLLAVSVQAMTATRRSLDSAQALADARSALLATYNEMVYAWSSRNRWDFHDPQDAADALSDFYHWLTSTAIPTLFRGQPVQVRVFMPEDASNRNLNPPGGRNGPSGYQFQNFIVQAVATRGDVTERLQTVVTISNALPAAGYAVCADQNLFFLGGPEVQGPLAAGSAVYFSSAAWAATGMLNNGNGPALTFAGQRLAMAAEPPGYEPKVLPQWDASTTCTAPHLFTFSRFHGQTYPTDTTWFHTDGHAMADKQEVSASALSSWVEGSHVITAPTALPSKDAVETVLAVYGRAIQSEAQRVSERGYEVHQGQNLPTTGGVVTYSGNHGNADPYKVQGDVTVHGPLYFEGDLSVPEGAVLHLKGPLYVTGNLTVAGAIDTTAAMYVAGWAVIEPGDNGVGATLAHPWVLYCGDDVTLSPPPGLSGMAQAESVALYGSLNTAGTLFLNGTVGNYRIYGNLFGERVVLDAVCGQSQMVTSGVVRSTDPSDLSRRLAVILHPVVVQHPPAWSPGYGDVTGAGAGSVEKFTVQTMPQPVRIP
jgi:type II secretory pathway pseudopilin PulG